MVESPPYPSKSSSELDALVNGCIESFEADAKKLFEKCEICELIINYLNPKGDETERSRTSEEIKRIILACDGIESENYYVAFNALYGVGKLVRNVSGNPSRYELTELGRGFARYALKDPLKCKAI